MKHLPFALVVTAQVMMWTSISRTAWSAWSPPPSEVDAVVSTPSTEPVPWTPPEWLPGETAWAIPELDQPARYQDGPPVRARAAIIADLDRGEVLWERRADTRYPVASLTKMVSALALAEEGPDLSRTLCVSEGQWTTRPGARSRFETGACHEGWDFLGAALVHSDNRGAIAMAALSDLPYSVFVDRMNRVTRRLGMGLPTFTDPAGLEDDNLASARDMLVAVVAVSASPMLAEVASAPVWQITRHGHTELLSSTNRLVRRYETLAAKTGYTDPAGYCFAQVIRTEDGRTLATVVLGAPTMSARFDDTVRLVEWAASR